MAKKKLNYPEVAANIIREGGGKENISSVRHCITRVRFRLKDESIVNDDTVKNLEGVISVVHGGGEYMCVIGNQVEEVYDEVVKQLGDLGVDKGAPETDQKEKKNETSQHNCWLGLALSEPDLCRRYHKRCYYHT